MNLKFRIYQETDLMNAIKILEVSGNTSRTEETWKENNLTAALALHDEKIVGIVPFEPRTFSLGDNEIIDILWVSGAHVEPTYRGSGIGSTLDQLVRSELKHKYDGIFVYREDKNSPAYKWYLRLGYVPMMKLKSLKKEVSPSGGAVLYDFTALYENNFSELQKRGPQFFALYRKLYSNFGGLPIRNNEYWYSRVKFHYYKKYYCYYILTLGTEDRLSAFALLGKTNFKDNIDRFDILDFAVENADQEIFFKSIEHLACSMNLAEIRIQCAEEEDIYSGALRNGFQERWETNLMTSINNLKDYCIKVFQRHNLDVKCFNENGNEITLSYAPKGGEQKTLILNKELMLKLLLKRLDGITDLPPELQKRSWIYRHLDYI